MDTIKNNWRWGLAVLALAMLAALSNGLLQTAEQPAPARASGERHDPDFYLKDFTLTTMDKTGAPRNRLESPYMVHYADDGVSEVTTPRMRVFRKDAPPWQIDAGTGVILAEGKTVLLRDGVVIRQNHPQNGQHSTLRTADLTVTPDREFAETASPVSFTDSAGNAVDAVGMRANFTDERLELLSQVRGKYVSAKN
jgi:lipopolysaccharide export system protein LptC